MYAKLKGAKVFSTIDLRSGYHHITLGKSSRAKTAFVIPFGKYEFLMVPFDQQCYIYVVRRRGRLAPG